MGTAGNEQTSPVPDHLPDAIVDAAITWSVKLNYNHATPATQQAFDHWLRATPLHRQAWERVSSLRNDFTKMPPQLALDTLQAIETKRQNLKLSRRHAVRLLSLASLTVSVGWLVRDNTPWQRMLADASTATGEQKTLHLTDGTVIVLNTDSAISTDLIGQSRLVTLRRGEIMVTTGADTSWQMTQPAPRRPFWVETPNGWMQALGTRFVVRLNEQGTRISVQEGAVALHPADVSSPDSRPVIVHTGESRWLMNSGTALAEALGFEDDAFADGVIAGKNIRLGDLITELSRYRAGHIVCDTRVADLRVSGVFHIKDTDQALQFLVQTQPVSVIYRTRFWVTVGPERGS
ncbi:FecR domain-containing protein [Rhodoferax sp. U11-2br]|nr:FecR domain-containing protein [Rhodoferax sp. U11-2br]